MIFFEHLFIVIAKPYIKLWSKYKNWWVGVRYGITLLVLCNLLTFLAITKDTIFISGLIFMSIITLLYLIISFINPKLNDKDFVKNFEIVKIWKRVVISYIITSILLCILTFWIFIIGI